MKKYILTVFILIIFSGCQTVKSGWQGIKDYGSKKLSRSKEESTKPKAKKSKGYLNRTGSTVKAKKELSVEDKEKGEFSLSDFQREELKKATKTDLIKFITELEVQLKKEEKTKDRLLNELSSVKIESQREIFDLTNKLETSKQKNKNLKDNAVKAEIEAMKAKQKLDGIKLNLLANRELFQSRYPIYYQVLRGDSLWKIAAKDKIYNDPYKWLEIYYANKDKVDNKDLLYPGMVLKIPRYHDVLLSNFGVDTRQVILEKEKIEN